MQICATVLILFALLVVSASGQTQSLSSLVTTNKPGDYPLQLAWSGIARVTARTGWFVSKDGRKETDEQLRFDMFTSMQQAAISRYGPRFIWEDAGQAGEGRRMGHIYTYRASLPLDMDLTAARKVSSLTNLFGPSHDPTDGWGTQQEMHSTAGWRFFSLGRSNTIETLSVFCMTTHRRNESESTVDSIIVKRGTVGPAKR